MTSQNGGSFLFLIAIMLFWWYVPREVSNRYILRAQVESDPAKRKELLKWAIAWGGNANLHLELLYAILQIAEESKDPHQKLRSVRDAEMFAEGLLRSCSTESPDFIELRRIVAVIKNHRQKSQEASDAAARTEREKFKVLRR